MRLMEAETMEGEESMPWRVPVPWERVRAIWRSRTPSVLVRGGGERRKKKGVPPQPMSRIMSSGWGSSHSRTLVASLGTKDAEVW